MSWKSKIQVQLKVASKQKAISSGLRELAQDLLTTDSPFILVYSSGREQYMSIQFTGEVTKKTKVLILKEYGINVWNIIKPKTHELEARKRKAENCEV